MPPALGTAASGVSNLYKLRALRDVRRRHLVGPHRRVFYANALADTAHIMPIDG